MLFLEPIALNVQLFVGKMDQTLRQDVAPSPAIGRRQSGALHSGAGVVVITTTPRRRAPHLEGGLSIVVARREGRAHVVRLG